MNVNHCPRGNPYLTPPYFHNSANENPDHRTLTAELWKSLNDLIVDDIYAAFAFHSLCRQTQMTIGRIFCRVSMHLAYTYVFMSDTALNILKTKTP